ncbi:hypothetical protein [Alloyangia pacifica]|uniref:Lipoprotein n=1 Tax=Alloyangia pacifica TaxID=311180 RepID=A0A1I6NZ43_9RHOB|nr:hypothetical protein [Alloyangia pacifica]SDH56248.1 hypothetical protein SAMN04488245_108103 [Alloyangia pacifica]SFS33221.1 hypothetical protein SAMN04488050_101200 [Alloyangia pacifica]
MELNTPKLCRTGAMLALAALLAACGASKDDPEFGGLKFRGSAKAVGDDRANFAATISNAVRAPSAAVDAGFYEGTKYCINYLGTSDIAWAVDPEAMRAQPRMSGKDLVMRGRCVE